MTIPFFYLIFGYVYELITFFPKYNIINSNNTITFQPNEILHNTFNYTFISNYILSLLPKIIIPLIFLLLIVLAYIMWIIISTCCLERTYSIYYMRFNKIIIDLSLLIFLACIGVAVSNNVYGFNYGIKFNNDLVRPINTINNLCDTLNNTMIELNALTNQTFFSNDTLLTTGKHIISNILYILNKNIFITIYNIVNFSYLLYSLIIIIITLSLLATIKKYKISTYLCMTNCNNIIFIVTLILFLCSMLIILFIIDIGNLVTNEKTYQVVGSIDNINFIDNTTFGSMFEYYYNCTTPNPIGVFFNNLRSSFNNTPIYENFINIENIALHNTDCNILYNDLHNFISEDVTEIIYVFKIIIVYYILMFASVLIKSNAFMTINKFIVNTKPEEKQRQLNILEYTHIRKKNKIDELPNYGAI